MIKKSEIKFYSIDSQTPYHKKTLVYVYLLNIFLFSQFDKTTKLKIRFC